MPDLINSKQALHCFDKGNVEITNMAKNAQSDFMKKKENKERDNILNAIAAIHDITQEVLQHSQCKLEDTISIKETRVQLYASIHAYETRTLQKGLYGVAIGAMVTSVVAPIAAVLATAIALAALVCFCIAIVTLVVATIKVVLLIGTPKDINKKLEGNIKKIADVCELMADHPNKFLKQYSANNSSDQQNSQAEGNDDGTPDQIWTNWDNLTKKEQAWKKTLQAPIRNDQNTRKDDGRESTPEPSCPMWDRLEKEAEEKWKNTPLPQKALVSAPAPRNISRSLTNLGHFKESKTNHKDSISNAHNTEIDVSSISSQINSK